jgi:hypothetical protein
MSISRVPDVAFVTCATAEAMEAEDVTSRVNVSMPMADRWVVLERDRAVA